MDTIHERRSFEGNMKSAADIEASVRKCKAAGQDVTDADLLIEYLQTRLVESYETSSEALSVWAKLALASPEQLRTWANEKEERLNRIKGT